MKKIYSFAMLLLTSIATIAQTNVSGFISTNTTWDLIGSPYIITGNVLLDSGYTLTIDAGVTVKFDANKSLQIGGQLIAIGTNTSTITFTSNAASPTPGDWDFISFNTQATDYDSTLLTGNTLQYCIVEYGGGAGNGAIQITDAFPYFSDCKIRNNANTGIYYNCVFLSTHPSGTLKINNSTFYNNTSSGNGAGVNLYLGQFTTNTAIITNNTFVNNVSTNTVSVNGGGAICIADALSNSTVMVTNNTIFNNTSMNNGGGINIFAYSGTSSPGLISNVYIANNIINHNTAAAEGGGIYVQAHGLVTNNTLYDNTALAGGGITEIGITTTNNLIVKNHATTYGGYHCAWFGDPLIKNHIVDNTSNDFMVSFANDIGVYNYNTITRNTTANAPNSTIVFMDGSNNCSVQTNCHNNNLYGNKAAFQFTNNRPAGCDINAKNSWWGTASTATIDNSINDYFDNSTKSIIYYSPIQTTPDTTAPVTPVFGVTKTDLGGGNIQLNWVNNTELDLAGYKVYWGSPTGYSFSNSFDAGNTNSYIVAGANITDTIAVTAYDTQMDGTNDMYETHESWYTNAIAAPVINFTSSDTIICISDSIAFTDNTTDAATWNWTFAGGTPSSSTLQNPIVTYNTSGNYDVTLVVTNIAGMDSVTVSNMITVNSHPNNDNCSGAQIITPTATAVGGTSFFAGDVACATGTLGGCSGIADDDVWYAFTTTAAIGQPYVITVAGDSCFDAVIQVFSGTCGSLSSISCTNTTGAGATEMMTLTTGFQLNSSTQYWFRVYDAGTGTPCNTTFTVSVTIPPVNDDCFSAINIIQYPSTVCGGATTGDVDGATQSLSGCTGTANDDVWYSFVAVNTNATITVVGSASFNAVVQVFLGSCSTLSNLTCVNSTVAGGTETVCLTGLTPGATYFIRVYDFTASTYPATTSFTICVTLCSSVGVDELTTEENIVISSGVNIGLFNVESLTNKINGLKIYNVVGEIIYQTNMLPQSQLSIDISQHPRGIYFLEVETEKGIIRKKIVKQ